MLKVIAPGAVFLLALVGCHDDRPAGQFEEAPFRLTSNGLLQVRPDLLPLLKFAKAELSDVAAQLPGVGEIVFAPNAKVALRVPFDGIVESVEVETGQIVAENQVLARIRSSELAKIRADVRRLTAELEGEYDAIKRAGVLVEKEAVSARRVVELQAKIGALEAQRNGLLLALRSARTTLEGEDLFELRSPRAGHVILRKLDPGEQVRDPENEPPFLIADPSNLVVHANFPERDAPLIKEGFPCRIEISALGDARFEGRVHSVVQAIDPRSRSVQVSCRFESPHARVRANMLARVTVSILGKQLLVVPREAVLLRQDTRVVLVRHGECELERRPVVVGANIDSMLEVVSGLHEDEEVVVDGAVLLDGELDRLL